MSDLDHISQLGTRENRWSFGKYVVYHHTTSKLHWDLTYQ